MGLTNSGRNFLAQALIGDSTPTLFSAANARIGVGNNSTAFVATQTNLVGTNLRKAMESGWPSRTNNAIEFKASFTAGEANFVWNEWGIFNDGSAGVMFSRKVNTGLGTKDGGIWNFTVTVTINN